MSPLEKAFKEKLKPFIKSQETPQVPEYHHEDERDEYLEFDARNFYEENCDKEAILKNQMGHENPEEPFKIKLHPIGPPSKMSGTERVKQIHPSSRKPPELKEEVK